MLVKFLNNIKKYTEILALFSLIVVTIISTTFYNFTKQKTLSSYKNIINNILTKSGFSAAYLSPSISGIFFSTLGIGSGTFQSAHAANIGNKNTIPIPILARISAIFPEVEKS